MSYALQNIISLYSFVAVLAIHNSIRIFVDARSESVSNGTVQNPLDGPFLEWAPFLITLVLIFRYFLGDLMFLRKYEELNDKLRVPDFVSVLVNAVMLAYLSFFVGQPAELFKLILILYAFDIIWWAWGSFSGLSERNSSEIDPTIGQSIFLSAIKLVIFLVLYGAVAFFDLDQKGASPTLATVIAAILEFNPTERVLVVMTFFFMIDAIVDLWLRGPSYLGRDTKRAGS